jgi:pimeloyl-ACP methyl ester carboxylesterase
MVADVFAVLDALDIERCVLAAESSGGAVVLLAALQQPQRFEGLVLVSGLYYRPLPDSPSPFVQGLQANYAATVSQFVEWCLPEPDSTAVRHWGRQILMQASQAAAIRLYECMDGLDLRPQMSQITLPTLLIHGDADVILPVESSHWLAANMPNSHLEVFPGAGHAPMMTFPQEVAAAINHYFQARS